MDREAHIKSRLIKHYAHVQSLGYDIAGVFLQGSQNYGLDIYEDDYMSDVDSKVIIIPTLEDLISGKSMVSTKYDFEGEQIDVKDVRLVLDVWKKQNQSYLEILFTDFMILNPHYETYMRAILDEGENIAKMNIPQLIKCMAGMSREKLIALKHPYPSIKYKIDKFGCDGKQAHHILRLNLLMRDLFIENKSFKDSLTPSKSFYNLLLDLKKNNMSLGEIELLAKNLDDNTVDLKNHLISTKFTDYPFQSATYQLVKTIMEDMILFSVKESLK